MNPSMTVALLGDVMLGGRVNDRIVAGLPVFADDVRMVLAEANLVICNLECCLTRTERRWPSPGKRHYFRASPSAAQILAEAGIDVVTLANNHTVDYGHAGLVDTITALRDVGIETVGAGVDVRRARAPAVVGVGGLTVGVIGVTDHPADYAATTDRPGVAFADLRRGIPGWLQHDVELLSTSVDVTIVTPHWGPNFVTTPRRYVQRAAADLLAAGAGLVAGHSAHVMHGTRPRIVFDLGDAVNDYPPHPLQRCDLGAVWLAGITPGCEPLISVVPTVVVDGQVRRAHDEGVRYTATRLRALCEEYGIDVMETDGVLSLVTRPAASIRTEANR